MQKWEIGSRAIVWARNRFLSHCFFLIPNIQYVWGTYHWYFISLLKFSQSANSIYYPYSPETFSDARKTIFENHLWCSSSRKLPNIYTCKMPTDKNKWGRRMTSMGPRVQFILKLTTAATENAIIEYKRLSLLSKAASLIVQESWIRTVQDKNVHDYSEFKLTQN